MKQETVKDRSQIDPAYLWNLEDMVPGTEAWEADFARCREELPALAAYDGRLGESAGLLAEALEKRSSLQQLGDMIYSSAVKAKEYLEETGILAK